MCVTCDMRWWLLPPTLLTATLQTALHHRSSHDPWISYHYRNIIIIIFNTPSLITLIMYCTLSFLDLSFNFVLHAFSAHRYLVLDQWDHVIMKTIFYFFFPPFLSSPLSLSLSFHCMHADHRLMRYYLRLQWNLSLLLISTWCPRNDSNVVWK